jgi:flagellar biosynthesis/type III secretory pathway ATPase
VEGDDFNEPICDSARSILDGHIVLSRRLAASSHYPAIDVSHSISRLFSQLASPRQQSAAGKIREALALIEESRDLIDLGAYVAGKNARLDAALQIHPEIVAFLRQANTAKATFDETCEQMNSIAERL